MVKRLFVFACVAASVLFVFGTANAYTVNLYEDGVAESIVGLDVDGVFYDVTWYYGMYNEGATEDDLPETDTAIAAAQTAINDALSTYGITALYNGEGDDFADTYYLIYYNSSTDRGYEYSKYSSGSWADAGTGHGAFNSDHTFAVLTTSAVPIPGALLLFGSSLFGIVGVRRRFKH